MKEEEENNKKDSKSGSGDFVFKWYPEPNLEFNGKEKDI